MMIEVFVFRNIVEPEEVCRAGRGRRSRHIGSQAAVNVLKVTIGIRIALVGSILVVSQTLVGSSTKDGIVPGLHHLQAIAFAIRGADHNAAFFAKLKLFSQFVDVLFNGAAGDFTVYVPDCAADCFA